ncbi:BREX-1 system adenine-specific DNA-methyltransferase PglX [Enterococcus italicus]|uniref:BREX-1 system adenine-specific DNA-methyltransferase PglX n=1 Tax=Enterococcus italicus TaxID=246144 RepID=UPI0020738E5D|nr:BREX-1 system adenine-specific DNA-methyltransferase PglX [Enterococcus italicus]MCM6931600.1 BREX-1 system adenine-specific DNA-methyltransferase PglX [Enterococcus italicus]
MAILIKDKFEAWEKEAQARFDQLKANEEELNKIFIELYGLQDELDYHVEDKDVSVSRADRDRDIKSLISYAVGCMFGRYSLNEEGLIFAGGEFDMSRYSKFKPVRDNILLITDDKYFQDDESDIMNKFVEFVTVVYGKETLEENLQYIADTLLGSGDSRDIIRKYFISKFYADHMKTYKKRPIYWQFESGKANGVKALMYLHRYDENLLGRLRTDYLSKLNQAYNARIETRESQKLTTSNAGESARYEKEIQKIKKQVKELQVFDEKIGHLALKKISLDLDDGVIVNYDKLQRDPETKEKFAILTKGVKEP